MRKGGTAQTELGTIAPEHPVWLSFARGMGPLMAPAARALAELVPLDSARPGKVLDIAASHGMYGIAAARRNPGAHLVALDWAPVLEVAAENARAAGLGDRFSTIAGSAFDVDLGADYDLILVPNFLHHFDQADCVRFLRKVFAALRSGGRVAIVEFVPNPDRISPPEAAGFSLVMLGTTPAGDAYTFAELCEMLEQSGFQPAQAHPLARRSRHRRDRGEVAGSSPAGNRLPSPLSFRQRQSQASAAPGSDAGCPRGPWTAALAWPRKVRGR